MDGAGEPGGPLVKEPEVIGVTFSKVSGSMGLSIVAARVCIFCYFPGGGPSPPPQISVDYIVFIFF